MKPLSGYEELSEALHRVKRSGTAFSTNLFAPRRQIESWIDRGRLSISEAKRSLVLLRRDQDFHHVYHCAADDDGLSTILSWLSSGSGPGSTLVADLVGRTEEVNRLKSVYEKCGFGAYTSLFRMVRLATTAADWGTAVSDAVLATREDSPQVQAFLGPLLDPLAEQVPEGCEIDEAIVAGKVLLVRHSQGIAGTLIFDQVGLTGTLRYWFVDEDQRGQGIGARLMKKFFLHCRECRRIVLWVISSNTDAIRKYEHLGFRADGLVDQIMIARKV